MWSWGPLYHHGDDRQAGLRADRTGGHEPRPRAADVVVHDLTGTVTRRRVARDERHWQIGADDEPTNQS